MIDLIPARRPISKTLSPTSIFGLVGNKLALIEQNLLWQRNLLLLYNQPLLGYTTILYPVQYTLAFLRQWLGVALCRLPHRGKTIVEILFAVKFWDCLNEEVSSVDVSTFVQAQVERKRNAIGTVERRHHSEL